MAQVLRDLSADMSELAKLREENERLKAKIAAKANGRLSIKVNLLSEDGKGNVSVYGLGRFPVTLYAKQWQRLLAVKEDILTAIEDNRDDLAWKEEA
jgi:hypothetical protein